MRFQTFLETSVFKVKHAQKFKDAFKAEFTFSFLDVDLQKDGLRIIALDLVNTDQAVEKFIQAEIKEHSLVNILTVGHEEVGGVASRRSIVSSLAIKTWGDEEVFSAMLSDLYPQRVTANISEYFRDEGHWIELGQEYLAIGSPSEGKVTIKYSNGRTSVRDKERFSYEHSSL